MGLLSGSGMILAVRPFGERDALVELLCPERGRLRGLVKGGRGTRGGMQAVLQPLNGVSYEHFRRLDGQLGTLTVEMVRSRSHLWLGAGHGAFVVPYLSELLAALLPEEHPYEGLEARLLRLLASDLSWREIVAFEVWLLEVVGYGLRLRPEEGVAGIEVSEWAFVSPASGRVVARDAAVGYEGRLLKLPYCMGGPECGEMDDFALAWRLTGFFIDKALHGKVLESRGRLGQAFDRALVRDAELGNLRQTLEGDGDNDIVDALAA